MITTSADGQQCPVLQLHVHVCAYFLEKQRQIDFFVYSIIPFNFFLFIRAEELEIALMEIVKQDNRRELSAKVGHECSWDFCLLHQCVCR